MGVSVVDAHGKRLDSIESVHGLNIVCCLTSFTMFRKSVLNAAGAIYYLAPMKPHEPLPLAGASPVPRRGVGHAMHPLAAVISALMSCHIDGGFCVEGSWAPPLGSTFAGDRNRTRDLSILGSNP